MSAVRHHLCLFRLEDCRWEGICVSCFHCNYDIWMYDFGFAHIYLWRIVEHTFQWSLWLRFLTHTHIYKIQTFNEILTILLPIWLHFPEFLDSFQHSSSLEFVYLFPAIDGFLFLSWHVLLFFKIYSSLIRAVGWLLRFHSFFSVFFTCQIDVNLCQRIMSFILELDLLTSRKAKCIQHEIYIISHIQSYQTAIQIIGRCFIDNSKIWKF